MPQQHLGPGRTDTAAVCGRRLPWKGGGIDEGITADTSPKHPERAVGNDMTGRRPRG